MNTKQPSRSDTGPFCNTPNCIQSLSWNTKIFICTDIHRLEFKGRYKLLTPTSCIMVELVISVNSKMYTITSVTGLGNKWVDLENRFNKWEEVLTMEIYLLSWAQSGGTREDPLVCALSPVFFCITFSLPSVCLLLGLSSALFPAPSSLHILLPITLIPGVMSLLRHCKSPHIWTSDIHTVNGAGQICYFTGYCVQSCKHA